MDPKEKELLQRTFEYTKENNKILKKIRFSMRLGSFLRIFYWIIIIGLALGLFYYLEPVLSELIETYRSLGGLENLENLIKLEPVLPN